MKTALWVAEEGELTQSVGRNLTPKLSGCENRGHQGWGAQGSQETLRSSDRANDGETSRSSPEVLPAQGVGPRLGDTTGKEEAYCLTFALPLPG